MTAQQLTDVELLYRKARDLVPTLRARTAETADLGMLPPETIDAMQAAGFFRIMQPARFGGFEMDPEVFFRVQMILAEGCMSTAWVLGVVAIHNWQLALFDEQADPAESCVARRTRLPVFGSFADDSAQFTCVLQQFEAVWMAIRLFIFQEARP